VAGRARNFQIQILNMAAFLAKPTRAAPKSPLEIPF